MSHQSDLIATDIDAYLALHEQKELLRLLTCGSVDDGKSTLIGRLLHDSKMIYEDQLAAIKKESAKSGTTGGSLDLALLVDGLQAEREQGITIDVAYRYFSTAKRKFIIADTPGHEQYTRNMATGASTCDLAVILIDARNGILTQTLRHTFIAALLGIKHIIVAVNKMDLVDFSEEVFDAIKKEYTGFAAKLDIEDVRFIPLSALKGDNVVKPSEHMPWYHGSTLMHLFETVHIASDRNLADFRFPVQYVNRPTADFRGYCGTVTSGVVRRGDEIMILPSRKVSRVRRIVTHDGDLDEAFAPLSVTLILEDELDVSRGDMIVHPTNIPKLRKRFDAMIVWMVEEPLVPGRQYAFKQTTRTVFGSVTTLRYKVDVNSLERVDAPALALNEIGRCEITLTTPIAIDAYKVNRGTGSFVMIDRVSKLTVGAGMIVDTDDATARVDHWETRPESDRLRSAVSTVRKEERAARFGQQPVTILLTGLTAAGKTTTAYALERRLFDMGRASTVLDGQNMRLGISKDLGFGADDRSENLRRSVEVARLLNDAGLICILAFVAPQEEARQRAAAVVGRDRFLVVHLSAPMSVCRERDPEGFYAAADAGEIADIPGVSFRYEEPKKADLVLLTHEWSVKRCVDELTSLLEARRVVT